MQNFYLDFIIGLINESEILKSAKDAYHKSMLMLYQKSTVLRSVEHCYSRELFKISCADPNNFPGGSEGYFSLLGRSEASYLY